MDELFELFPDKYPVLAGESTEEWTFSLEWPKHILEPIDPMLCERAKSCYDMELAELADYQEVRDCGRAVFLFSMFHSRALGAPALALAREPQAGLRRVVHVDAHHDLSTGLLAPSGNDSLVNREFGIDCCLRDFDAVKLSVDRGFIHKGSFLTAYVLGTEPGELFHIQDQIEPASFSMRPVTEAARVGERASCRYSVSFERELIPEAWQIVESPRLPAVLQIAQKDRVWLDIDLDAFCNRFDGDSDNSGKAGTAEETAEMRRSITKFLSALRKADWRRNIAAVSVAASPGFFPSEHWEYAIPTISDELCNILSAT